MAGLAGRRGAPRLLRPRPRPADPRRVAGGHQAPAQAGASPASCPQVQSARRTKPNMWFWRVQSLPDVLSRWSKGLPPESVHLVTVPQAGAPAGPAVAALLPGVRHRPGLGAGGERPGERVDRRGRDHADPPAQPPAAATPGLPSEEYRRLVRELVVHQTLAQRPGMAKVTLPPAAFPWADEVADEWIEWVVGSGIDVIGDVEDLRPVPPAAEDAVGQPRPPAPRRDGRRRARRDRRAGAGGREPPRPARADRRQDRPRGPAAAAASDRPTSRRPGPGPSTCGPAATTPWSAWVERPAAAEASVPPGWTMPGAAQLELVRRLARRLDRRAGRDADAFRGLADLVLGRSGPGPRPRAAAAVVAGAGEGAAPLRRPAGRPRPTCPSRSWSGSASAR